MGVKISPEYLDELFRNIWASSLSKKCPSSCWFSLKLQNLKGFVTGFLEIQEKRVSLFVVLFWNHHLFNKLYSCHWSVSKTGSVSVISTNKYHIGCSYWILQNPKLHVFAPKYMVLFAISTNESFWTCWLTWLCLPSQTDVQSLPFSVCVPNLNLICLRLGTKTT